MDGALRLDQGQPPPVVIDNIGMIFGVTVALEAVNLAVSGGELVAVIGPSGCGKSTLLRIVAGLVEPTDGVVTVGGLSPHEILAQHDCGFLFQTPLMLPWLTLRENVALAGRLIGVSKKERVARADEWIGRVGLGGFENHRPHELSGGMRQRAALARALTLSPRLLLMDEPLGALDEITRRRLIFEVLQTLSGGNATVLLVTHSIEEAILMSDRIVVITAHPGTVHAVVENELPHPRTPRLEDDRRFTTTARLLRKLLDTTGGDA